MIFRFARHTDDLEKIKNFYINILGFELLGNFENHENYSGVFIGKQNQNWHLEFTQSNQKRKSVFDEDDILVLYPETEDEYNQLINNIKNHTFNFISAKNPYWNRNGKIIQDPDGHNIVISNLKIDNFANIGET